MIVLARSKTTFENKSALNGLRRKQKILTENVIRFAKSDGKSAFTPWRSTNRIEQSSAISKSYLDTLKQASSNSEKENTFCRARLFYEIAVLRQNHIKHDPKDFLNSIHFLTANLFDLKYQTWKLVNVRARPKTKTHSEKSFLIENYIQIQTFFLPPSTWFLL